MTIIDNYTTRLDDIEERMEYSSTFAEDILLVIARILLLCAQKYLTR